ncbi:hypothetical protein JTB14_032992 [Gonioctena quinquepunctata]|nr:hypothetical protein JTB14_032992 [Gonioctena quinquepunctata]
MKRFLYWETHPEIVFNAATHYPPSMLLLAYELPKPGEWATPLSKWQLTINDDRDERFRIADENSGKYRKSIFPTQTNSRKAKWPKINETLKNYGITSVKNFNTRDGIRMILPSMDSYTKSTNILDQEKVQYHTFRSPQEREIRAIFKGIAEDIETTTIMKDFQDKGFAPRVIGDLKQKRPEHAHYPCHSSRVTSHDKRYKPDLRFEKFGHSAYNCKAEPSWHCAGNPNLGPMIRTIPNKQQLRGPTQIKFQRMPPLTEKDRNEATTSPRRKDPEI